MTPTLPTHKHGRPDLVIGFDADDTLWHNETYYRRAAEEFAALLEGFNEPEQIRHTLADTEVRNIGWYGYGFKSYTLSMIEAAITATAGQVPARVIESILEIGREMLNADVVLFEQAGTTLTRLAAEYDLMLITKGDLLEQANKVKRSGLTQLFRWIEIIQDKTPESYKVLLDKYGIAASRFIMVGNSLKSDILPALGVGARAVYIPYEHTWVHEHADAAGQSYYEIEDLGQLPDLLASLHD